MDKLDKRMTITINAYGEDVEITAPAWLLNEISIMYRYSAELYSMKGKPKVTIESLDDRSSQIYQELKKQGLYD